MYPTTRIRPQRLPSTQSHEPCLFHPRHYSLIPRATGHALSVLITGGSRGIGLAIAKQFAQHHPNVQTTIIGRDESTLQSATRSIVADSCEGVKVAQQHGYIVGDITSREFWESLARGKVLRATTTPNPPSAPATARGWDVTSREFWESLVRGKVLRATTTPNPPSAPATARGWDVTSREFWESLVRGKVLRATTTPNSPSAPATACGWDVVVNAAGISRTGIFARQTANAIEDVFHTNLMGTTWACRYMIPAMLKRARDLREAMDSGHHPGMSIVNVSSLLGVKGGTGSAAYAASKAGVLGLTRALAAEYGPLGLRVNALVPGYVETAMTDAMHPKARDLARESIPLKRFGTVDEIASAAVFLATNPYANNCVINIDGGLSAT